MEKNCRGLIFFDFLFNPSLYSPHLIYLWFLDWPVNQFENGKGTGQIESIASWKWAWTSTDAKIDRPWIDNDKMGWFWLDGYLEVKIISNEKVLIPRLSDNEPKCTLTRKRRFRNVLLPAFRLFWPSFSPCQLNPYMFKSAAYIYTDTHLKSILMAFLKFEKSWRKNISLFFPDFARTLDTRSYNFGRLYQSKFPFVACDTIQCIVYTVSNCAKFLHYLFGETILNLSRRCWFDNPRMTI